MEKHYKLLASQVGNLASRIASPKLQKRFLQAASAHADAASLVHPEVQTLRKMFLRCREVLEERLDGMEISRGLEEAMEMVFEASSSRDHVVRVRCNSLTVSSCCAGQPTVHRSGTLEVNNERHGPPQRHGLRSRSTSLDRHCLVSNYAKQDDRTAGQPDGQLGDAHMAAFGLGRKGSSGSGCGECQIGWVRGKREEAGFVPCVDGRAGGMRLRCSGVEHRNRPKELPDLFHRRTIRYPFPFLSTIDTSTERNPTPFNFQFIHPFSFFDNAWRSAFTTLWQVPLSGALPPRRPYPSLTRA